MENRRRGKQEVSDYASVYKMTSGNIDKRVIRAQRRSLDWKKLRHDEVNKRRNLDNLSPLQESSDQLSTTNKSYKGETPVKLPSKEGARVTPKRGVRHGTPKMDLRKEKMLKWRQERDMKRKLEAMERAKHQPFRVCHIEHKDDVKVFKKNMSKESKKPAVPTAVKAEKRVTRSTVQSKPAPKAVMKTVPVSKTLDKPPKKNFQQQDKFTKPVPESGRVTRSSNTKAPNKPVATRNLRSRPITSSEPHPVKTKVTKASKTLKQNAEMVHKESDLSAMDTSKVSTYRGDSFAPADFTFAAPGNVSSFVFKPLSPASAANFLFPNQDSSSSFLGAAPNRCSTPISGKSRKNSLPLTNSDNPEQNGEHETDKTVLRDVTVTEGTLIVSVNNIEDTNSPENVAKEDGRHVDKHSDDNMAMDDEAGTHFTENGITDSKNTSNTSSGIKNDIAETSLCANDNTIISVSEMKPKNSVKKSVSIKIDTAQNSMVCDDVFNGVESSSDVKTLKEDKENAESKKTPVRQTRNSRRTMSAVDRFVHPTNQTLPLSGKRSGRKRRRSENSHPYSAKSPEEWVKLLKQSPMVEMSRRTPKHKTPADDSRPPPVLNFDDLDLDDSLSEINNAELPPVMEDLHASEAQDPCVERTSPEIGEAKTDLQQQPTEGSTSTAAPETKSADRDEGAVQMDIEEEHNAQYFRLLITTETNRLNQLCDHWNSINSTSNLSEDVEGQIRTTTGQAQLLIAQRFKQFTGLIDNCEFKRGEKETTCTDLQGFWDMIFFQVEDVNTKFKDLEKLQANDWQIPEEKIPVKKNAVKKAAKKISKPAVKSKFAAFRAKIKKQNNENTEKNGNQEDKVFDAGFFSVSSPVRKDMKPHCEGGTPRKSLPDTEPTDLKSTEPNSETLTSSGQTSQNSVVTAVSVLTPTPAASYFTPFRTPRRSYVPVVPSPLLNDITPQPKQRRRSSIRKTPMPKRLSKVLTTADDESKENILSDEHGSATAIEGKKKTRRSLRLRKSVCFNEMVETLEEKSSEEACDDSFSRLLQPSSEMSSPRSAGSSRHTSALESSPFGDNSHLDESDSHKSCLKQLPSVDRRRTRRSVQFSPLKDTDTHKMPTTPFNRDSLVAQSRIKKRRSSLQKLNDQPSVNKELEQLVVETEKRSPARKSRPSLLYTPPKRRSSSQTTPDVPTDILISFSP